MIRRICAVLLSMSFLTAPSASYAQGAMDALGLPLPGAMVTTSPLLTPPLIKGIIVDVNNPLAFRFVVDSGKTDISAGALQKAVEQQTKYFLTGLTVDPKDLWVNLSPYEQDRMVPETLGKTDLGRDMLAQDYILKQLSASMLHPDGSLGKDFWARVYAQAKERFGTTEIPVDTFNKIWIMPDDAVVFENGNRGYVTKATLKVLLEEDYLALEKGRAADAVSASRSEGDTQARALTTQVMREVVLPAITKEVNEGANFAPLRQIYHALVLAKWYKETVSNQLLSQVYFGKGQVDGVDLADQSVREGIYQRYVEAYKTGVFNFIKEETDSTSGEAFPRKYFSGGENFDFSQMSIRKTTDPAAVAQDGKAFIADVDLAQTSGSNDLISRLRNSEQVDPVLLAEVYRKVREQGLFLNDGALKELAGPFLASGMFLLNQLVVSGLSRDPSRAEAPKAQYIISQLSNTLAAHEITHLAHPAATVGNFVSPFQNKLPPEGIPELRELEKMAQAVMRDNLGIKLLLGKFAVFSNPERAVSFLDKILRHIEEAKTLNAQLSSFARKYGDIDETVQIVPELCDDASELIVAFEEKMKKLQQDASTGVIMQDIDFPKTVSEIVTDLEGGYRVNISVSLERGSSAGKKIFFSYYDLRALLEVLIDNARQAARPGVPLEIGISVGYEGKDVVLRVQDNGTGMTPEQQAKIQAQEIFTTKGDFGSGQGLEGVREVLALYSGSMDVSSILGQGTAFTLRFPINPGSDSAMGASTLSLAAVPMMADVAAPQTAWTVTAVLAVATPALIVMARYWGTEHFVSILRRTQDPAAFIRAAGALRHFAKENVVRENILARYMDMNSGIRTSTRILVKKFAYTGALTSWLEKKNIIAQLGNANPKIRDNAKALMTQHQLSSLERAEACATAIEREINKTAPSLVVLEENLVDLLSFRKRAYEAFRAAALTERTEAASFDQTAISLTMRIMGWGPEEAFPLAARALDQLSKNAEIPRNLYQDIIEGAPKLETRLNVFRRIPARDQKILADQLWARLLEPHMLFDVSVMFLLKIGYADKKRITERVLESLRRSHYLQDPLRAPHIRALNFLGVKGFSNAMSQRQFEQAIGAAQIPGNADMAMGFSALSVMAAAYADPDVIDRLLSFVLEDHLYASIGIAGVVATASIAGLAVRVQQWNARAYENLLDRVRHGSVDSRIKALIELKSQVPEGTAYNEFSDLLNDPEVVLDSQQREALQKNVFLFGRWLAYDIPILLIDPSKDVRDRGRKLLRDKVSLREQGEAYMWAIQREFMRLSNTRHDYEANPVLLELIDDMLSIRGESSVRRDLDGKFEKVLLSILPDSGIQSMEKIRDAVVALRAGVPTTDINRAIVRGTVDAEFSKRLLSRLEGRLPVVNVEDVVLFLLHTETVKPARLRSLVFNLFMERWQQMDQALRDHYLSALVLLGTEGAYPGMDQNAIQGFFGIDKGPFAGSDQAQFVKGGIDVSGLDVARTGKGIQVFFDPAMLAEFAGGTFKGFRPVIVGITPASNLSSVLGL